MRCAVPANESVEVGVIEQVGPPDRGAEQLAFPVPRLPFRLDTSTPPLATVLGLEPLTLEDWVIIAPLAAAPAVIRQVLKRVRCPPRPGRE